MIKLPNNCSYNSLFASPKNWRSLRSEKDAKKTFFVQLTFFDPKHKDRYPKGFKFRKKINRYAKTLGEKKELLESLLKKLPEILERGYNPIDKKYNYTIIPNSDIQLSPHTDFINALEAGLTKIEATPLYIQQATYTLKKVKTAILTLEINDLEIREVKRSHIKNILDTLNLTPSLYNVAKTHLSGIFNQLMVLDCIEDNPCHLLPKKTEIKKIRKTLTEQEKQRVIAYLKENHYQFYRYMLIFYCSGSRTTELLSLKKEDIDLEKREFKLLIKKGKLYKEVLKPILPLSYPLWKELVDQALPGQYLISHNYKPGNYKVSYAMITQFWKKNIKDNMNIEADFYSLKHSFLDSLSMHDAKAMAAHTSEKTTSIYRVNEEKRQRDQMKEMDIDFV